MKGEELPPISSMIEGSPERSMREPAFSLFSGLIIMASSWWLYQTMVNLMGFIGPSIGPYIGVGFFIDLMLSMYIIGMFCGGMNLLGGLIMFMASPKAGGIITIIFSIMSYIGGGGFMIGMILGIVAGALALQSKKPPEPGASTEIL